MSKFGGQYVDVHGSPHSLFAGQSVLSQQA
jgi:hypothetical protein